ncbi:MAG: ArnT family glycosyltransferase [Solirubrobacteraceae bacterium]
MRSTLSAGAVAAAAKLALALPFLNHYGWDRDELYYLQASRHLSLGYVDFPFMTALIGRLVTDVAGPSLVALRLTGVVAGMAATVLIALCARELGGGTRTQLFAALAFVLTPYGLGIGVIFHPTMFDALAWVAFTYVALRILRRPQPRLWPLLGLIAGIGLETKDTIAALLLAFVLALLIVGPRRVLHQRRPLTAAVIALACLTPYVVWEITHGWPSLTFLPTQDAETAASTPPLSYLSQQIEFLGSALVLVVLGVRELWRTPQLRALALLAPATTLLFFLEHGRSYYALPAIGLPLAAGAVSAARWWTRSRHRALTLIPLATVQLAVLAIAAPLVWPVLPTATMIKLGAWRPTFYGDEIGWPQLAAQTAQAWHAIPLRQRRDTALLTQNYGEAGALALYGPPLGLPQPLSGHLSYQYWHPHHMPQRHILAIGFTTRTLATLCKSTHIVARITNQWSIANQEQSRPIATCTLTHPLDQLWNTRIASDSL